MNTEFLSKNQEKGLLKSFEGKTITEVVCSLPTWPLLANLELENPEIEFFLLKYNLKKYEARLSQWYQSSPEVDIRETPDVHLSPIKAFQGEEINSDVFEVRLDPDWALGLASKIRFTPKGESSPVIRHLPLMDFDCDFGEPDEQRALGAVIRGLWKEVEMEGLVLKSSEKLGHFGFLGNHLLTHEQFLFFLGLCLLLEDGEGRPLADSRYIGHSLTRGIRSMKYLISIEERGYPVSIYQKMEWRNWPYPDFFTVMRIKPAKPGHDEPRVIGALVW